MGVWELGASGSAMMRVYLVVVGSRWWRLEERNVVAIKILREKWEKVFTKVGLGCEAERRCIDGLCCFFFSNQRSRLRVFREQRRSEKKEDLPRVEKILPSSTALLAYDTLNALLGRKSGIKLGVLRSN